ncbi:R-spondin-3 [Hemicordylus capensis]|uniref:R-spondin-3 n=1 Tax=Hemicordylus capensis TaxID=884348 RepID=UPI0023025205|nr:R-spondin-3 [Hemicordylus capensis]
MQLRLVSWFFITLNLMEYIGSRHPSRVRRQGRMPPNVSQACQGGCATCSEYNGCLTCKPRYFFFLERSGMRQTGLCLSSCPRGYFGTRFPEPNGCTKCKADCDACEFNSNFCTKCNNGFYLLRGKCLENCPERLEPNNHTMECNDIVDCKTSEWSPWTACTKKGKTCFKRGNKTRVREILQLHSTKGNPCPHTSETRKCVVQRKKCQKGGKGRKNREERRKKPKREESKEARQENKGRESRSQNREQQENKSKMQLKKRRAQEKMAETPNPQH